MAKVVSYSPMRSKADHFSVKNSLDAPFKLKWPKLSREVITQIKEEVEQSLRGITVKSKKSERRKRKRSNKNDSGAKLMQSTNEPQDISEPLGKRQHCGSEVNIKDDDSSPLDPSKSGSNADHVDSNLTQDSPAQAQCTSVTVGDLNRNDCKQVECGEVNCRQDIKIGNLTEESGIQSQPIIADTEDSNRNNSTQSVCCDTKDETTMKVETRNQHLVLGINAVTRLLEQRRLEVGLVCTSTPYLLYQHLIPLAAVAEVPFAALPELNGLLSSYLGIKRTACMGIKKSSDKENHFSSLCNKIRDLVSPIPLPWMKLPDKSTSSDAARESPSLVMPEQITEEDAARKLETSNYHSLEIKRLKIQSCKQKNKK